MNTTPFGDSDPDIKVFLLTDSDVLAQERSTSLWRSVASPGEDAPSAPTPAQLRNLKRMHPAYHGRLARADGAKPRTRAGAADGGKMEIYDPLTSSWSAVPVGTDRAQVGEAVCCILPDGRVLIGSPASACCATYDPGTNRWSTSPVRPARSATSRRSGGPASVIAVRMSN
jgi:hypothetical protein